MVIVGIDQALTKSGFAVYLPQQRQVYYLTVSTKAKEELYARLSQITTTLARIQQRFGEINEVYTEAPFLFKTTSSATKLIRVETAIHYYCYERAISFTSVACNPKLKESWPRQLGLSSTKEELQQKLQALGVELNDHESDSIGIVLGGHSLKTGEIIEYQSLTYRRVTL